MLRQIAFFAPMSDSELRQVARVAELNDYEPGSVIIEELEQGARFYLIVKGKIEITKGYGSHKQFVLGVYSDGDFFGEMALLDEGRRSATVLAMEPTTLLEISKDGFQELLQRIPALSNGLLKELSVRLRTTGALLVSYLQQRNRRLRAVFIETLRAIRDGLQYDDGSTTSVFRHTTGLARMIGVEIGLSKDDLSVLELRSLLHDLAAVESKVGDIEILESANPEEDAVETPGRGPESLLETEISHVLSGSAVIAEESGFPEDFLGTETYQVGSIMTVADAFSTIMRTPQGTTPVSPKQALRTLRNKRAQVFDPEVVEALAKIVASGRIR